MTPTDLTALRARLRERIGRKRRGYMLPVDTADLWDVLDALEAAEKENDVWERIAKDADQQATEFAARISDMTAKLAVARMALRLFAAIECGGDFYVADDAARAALAQIEGEDLDGPTRLAVGCDPQQ